MTELEHALDEFVASKQKGSGSGNYQRNAGRVVERWLGWLADRHPPVDAVDDVDVTTMRAYARYLKRRVNGNGITGATARTYWDYIAAFLAWCVEEELLTENPARKKRAEKELPSETTSGETQQFWSAKDRKRVIQYVNKRAHDAVDEKGSDAIVEVRDRALVSLLAYSGVRGAEVFRAPSDDRREGITWQDVDLEAGVVRVLGKSQEYEAAQLPAQAVRPLERYRRVLDPPTDAWPVFPTRHAPSLYARARDGLQDEDVDELLEERDVEAVLREHELPPASITTAAARQIMKGLCEDLELDVDEGYLQPHGARRGLGETLYRERGPAAAQRALRHASPETTADAYSHIEAEELAEDVSDVLDETG